MNNKCERGDDLKERNFGDAGQFRGDDPYREFRMAQPAFRQHESLPSMLPGLQLVDSSADVRHSSNKPGKSDNHASGSRAEDAASTREKPGVGDKPQSSPRSVDSPVKTPGDGKHAATDTEKFATGDSVAVNAARTATGRTVLDSNFKNFDGFKPSGNDTVQLTRGDAAHPTIAKLVLDRHHDQVSYRTELSTNSKDQLLQFDHDYSIKFTNRLVDWKTDKSADAIFQLHAIPADGKWTSIQNGKEVGLGGPQVMLNTSNGEYHFFAGKKEIWHGKIEEGQWNDWEVKMRVDGNPGSGGKGKDGYLELYRNGKLLASADGKNVAGVGAHGEPLKQAVYAKIGIYKWPWREGRPETDSSRREIDYSHFSIKELTP